MGSARAEGTRGYDGDLAGDHQCPDKEIEEQPCGARRVELGDRIGSHSRKRYLQQDGQCRNQQAVLQIDVERIPEDIGPGAKGGGVDRAEQQLVRGGVGALGSG